MSHWVSRRRLLRSSAALGLAGIAGCASDGGQSSPTSHSPTETRDQPTATPTTTERETATQSATKTPRNIEQDYEWVSDRYDHRNRAYNSDGGYFGEEPFQEWMISMDGVFGASPPLISGDYLYVVADKRLLTIDRQSGEVTRDVSLGYQAATPNLPGIGATILESNIYTASVNGGLYGHSLETSETTLSVDLGAEATTGVTASPTTSHVYVGDTEGSFYAVDIEEGEQTWQHQFAAQVRGRPAVSSSGVFIGDASGLVIGFDEETGEQIWQKQLDGGVSAPISVADGTVYVGLDTGDVYALAADSGSVIWKHDGRSQPVWRGMAVTEEYLWYVSGEKGIIVGVDRESGAGINHAYVARVYAPPVASNGQIFLGGFDGTIWCLSEATKKVKWNKQLDGQAWSLSVTGGELFLKRRGSELYRFTPVS